MENLEGSTYAELDSTYVDVTLDSELKPFLVPNIFCSYNAQSACVQKAKDLMKGVKNQGEAVREICTYVANNVSYDYDKAELLAGGSGYIPNADATLKEKKGSASTTPASRRPCCAALACRRRWLPATSRPTTCTTPGPWSMLMEPGRRHSSR